jgi:outer membrane lipoprotein SlyB
MAVALAALALSGCVTQAMTNSEMDRRQARPVLVVRDDQQPTDQHHG